MYICYDKNKFIIRFIMPQQRRNDKRDKQIISLIDIGKFQNIININIIFNAYFIMTTGYESDLH